MSSKIKAEKSNKSVEEHATTRKAYRIKLAGQVWAKNGGSQCLRGARDMMTADVGQNHLRVEYTDAGASSPVYKTRSSHHCLTSSPGAAAVN